MTHETQHEGLAAISHNAESIRDRVLRLIDRHGPQTDWELYERYVENGWGPLRERTVGARRYELTKDNMLRDSGARKINPKSGVKNILWERVPMNDNQPQSAAA